MTLSPEDRAHLDQVQQRYAPALYAYEGTPLPQIVRDLWWCLAVIDRCLIAGFWSEREDGFAAHQEGP